MPKIRARQREHITDGSAACWCNPVTLAYGDECVYDADGNLLRINRSDDGSEVVVHNDDIGAALGLDPIYLAEQAEPA